MDPLSVAASVAGVAAMGFQLSQTIYDLVSTFYEAVKEMSSIANDLSLLAMALNELEVVLQRDSRVYQRRMLRVVSDILNNCEGVFQSISKYTSVNSQDTRSSKQFQKKVCWYFQRHRVRPLQARLESMKSTLNVLLHVVHLARLTEAVEFFIPNAGRVFTQADVQKERRVLVGVVLENRQSILNLEQIEEDRDRGQCLRNIIEKREIEGIDGDKGLNDNAPTIVRNLVPKETTGSGDFNSFGAWDEGSSANTGTNTSFDSKEHNITTTGFDTGNSGAFVEKQGGEAERIYAGGNDIWGTFTTTTTKKKHNKNWKTMVDSVSNVKDPIVVDTTLGNSETAADVSWVDLDFASVEDKRAKKGKEEEQQRLKEMENNNQEFRELSPDSGVAARSASHSERDVEVYESSGAGSSGRPKSFNRHPKPGHANGADDLQSPLKSQENSLFQSPVSEYYSLPPEIPITDNTEPRYSEEYITIKPSRPQLTESAKGLATKLSKSQGSRHETEIVMPTAQWFLSVVPHESNTSALIVRPRSVEAKQVRARAEETVKTLLLNWTNVDPDFITREETSGDQNSNDSSRFHALGVARDERVPNQPYRLPYAPQAYPTYAPPQWYPPPAPPPPGPEFTLPLPPPPVSAAPPPSNEKQTDSEGLARLKKLILDEKAEQDAGIWAAAAAASPLASVASNITEDVLENTMQRDDTYMEAVVPIRMSQEHNTLREAEPQRLQPVIMRDKLGRKFIFPVDMCQTWKGLDKLIQEAFGHVLDCRRKVEKGCYSISHVTGEVILPSTWESFVQPGLEIDMEIYADQHGSVDKAILSGRRDESGQETLITPHAPEVPTPGSPTALRSRSDNEPSTDDVAEDGTEYSVLDGISYVERSDPRYLSIENVLLEQKKAKVNAAMKLESSKRFFQLKQQLMDQGAAIQARQDAADHAEQDAKLAWLEKQVRDQKEELNRLPPILMTPPSSSAGDLLSKSASTPQRRPSFGARLLARMPSRSIRSKGSVRSQQMNTEG